MKTKTLRDYQWDMVRDSVAKARTKRTLGLISPTGSGKTLILQAFLIKTHRRNGLFSGVVIAAPSLTTVGNFTIEQGIATPELAGPGTTGSHLGQWDQRRYDVPSNPIKKRNAFKSVLLPGYSSRAMVTTHAQLVASDYIDLLPDDLTAKLLIVDEAHHAGAGDVDIDTKIGEFTRAWLERGGTVLYTTATPFRTDGNAVLPEGTEPYIRSISTHAASHYAPNNFRISTIVMQTVEANTTQELSGDTLPPEDESKGSSYEEMVKHWLEQGRPKALFLVPPGKSEKGARRLEDVIREHAPGTRVGNFVGTGSSVAKALDEALEPERAVTRYEDSRYDIIIACQRFNEGTDWPLCSHVYCYGISSSFSLIIQRWGRAFRMKNPDPMMGTGGIKGHPHAEDAHIIFFVPKVKAELVQEFEKQHSDHALMLACLMADFETAQEYGTHKRIRYEGAFTRRPERKKKDPAETTGETTVETEEQALRRIQAEQAFEMPDHERARLHKEAVLWSAQMEQEGTPPTFGDFNNWITQQGYSPAEKIVLLETEGRQICIDDPGVLAHMEDAKEDLIDAVTTGNLEASKIATEYLKSFDEATASYRNKTTSFKGRVLQVVSSFTGEDAEDIAKRLHARVQGKKFNIPHTDIELARMLRDYADTHGGEIPIRGVNSDPSLAGLTLIPGTTVSDLEKHLKAKGITLNWFYWAMRNGALEGPPLNPADLRGLSRSHRRVLAKCNWEIRQSTPRATERGMTAEINGNIENVVALDLALWFGWRGLPGKQRIRDI